MGPVPIVSRWHVARDMIWGDKARELTNLSTTVHVKEVFGESMLCLHAPHPSGINKANNSSGGWQLSAHATHLAVAASKALNSGGTACAPTESTAAAVTNSVGACPVDEAEMCEARHAEAVINGNLGWEMTCMALELYHSGCTMSQKEQEKVDQYLNLQETLGRCKKYY
jgi:hypothetical protein